MQQYRKRSTQFFCPHVLLNAEGEYFILSTSGLRYLTVSTDLILVELHKGDPMTVFDTILSRNPFSSL
jgi:hypothetical protein